MLDGNETKTIPELKQAFIEAKRAKESMSEFYAEFERDLSVKMETLKAEMEAANAEMLETYWETDAGVIETENELREALKTQYEAAVTEYKAAIERGEEAEEPSKQFDSDLSVRVTPSLKYELSDATEWAKENAPIILVADKKQFEGLPIAKMLDFVTEVKTVSAVVSKKL